MSPNRYLPETMGPGVRLPRLRQRRLDGHLPGPKRPLRLLQAQDAAPERPLQEQPGRDVHRRHREGGRGGQRLRHGGGGRGLRQRRLARPVRHRLRPLAPSTTTTATAPSPTSPRRRGWRLRAGPRAPSGSTTTTTAGSTCSSAASSSSASTRTSSAATTSSGSGSTASPGCSSPTPSLLFHNNGDGTFTEVSKGTDIQKALGKGLGVVATDLNNDGLHGPVRGQRHGGCRQYLTSRQ